MEEEEIDVENCGCKVGKMNEGKTLSNDGIISHIDTILQNVQEKSGPDRTYNG